MTAQLTLIRPDEHDAGSIPDEAQRYLVHLRGQNERMLARIQNLERELGATKRKLGTAQAALEQRWTPIKRGEPPQDTLVLLTCRQNDGSKYLNLGWICGGRWSIHGIGMLPDNWRVLAWQHLPEAQR